MNQSKYFFLLGIGSVVVTSCLSAASAGAPNKSVADAAMSGDTATVRQLIQAKANLNLPQPGGTTAIHWAAYRNDLELADLLIGAGADVKLANRDGATALWLAAEN